MKSRFWMSALVASLATVSMAETLWEPERRLTRGSGAQTSINFARNVAADARGRVHLVWSEPLPDGHEIFAKRSADGGKSWGLPMRLTQASGDSHYPSIAGRRCRSRRLVGHARRASGRLLQTLHRCRPDLELGTPDF